MMRRRLQIANAGVNEIGDYLTPKFKNGKPEKPAMATVDVNLLGSIYSKDSPINRMRYLSYSRIFPSRPPGYPLLGARAKAR